MIYQSTSENFQKNESVINKIINRVRAFIEMCLVWLLDRKNALYGLSVARMLLGLMIVGFALSNLSTAEYTFGTGAAWTGQLEYPTSEFAKIAPFSWVNALAVLPFGTMLIFIALIIFGALFAAGFFTKFVMPFLFIFWVGSMSINTYVQDQSDNLTRIALIAMFFTAVSEKWSVDSWLKKSYSENKYVSFGQYVNDGKFIDPWIQNLLHNLALVTIICQLCFVYVSGGLFKAEGLPWQDGTAVYDPLQTERFGTWPILSDLATFWGPGVAILTIGTVLIQVSFPFMLLNRFTRIIALFSIGFFHLGIAVLMGLPWFSLSMIALDCVFITGKSWSKLETWFVVKYLRFFVKVEGIALEKKFV